MLTTYNGKSTGLSPSAIVPVLYEGSAGFDADGVPWITTKFRLSIIPLFWYLQMAGSTARAASLLTLHKNTMLYRLGRIRELLGMDLASGEDLFELQVSFRLLIALGLFHPRLRVTREQLRG